MYKKVTGMARIEIPYEEYRKLVERDSKLSMDRDAAVAEKEYFEGVCNTCLEIVNEIYDLSLWERVFRWKQILDEHKRILKKIDNEQR